MGVTVSALEQEGGEGGRTELCLQLSRDTFQEMSWPWVGWGLHRSSGHSRVLSGQQELVWGNG